MTILYDNFVTFNNHFVTPARIGCTRPQISGRPRFSGCSPEISKLFTKKLSSENFQNLFVVKSGVNNEMRRFDTLL